MFRRASALFLAILGLFVAAAATATAAEPSLTAAELLPATTMMYAEISRPAALVDLGMDHPVHARLREIEDYQKAFQTPQYQQFLFVVKMLEGAVEMRWRPALKLLAHGGVHVAVDGETRGAVLLVKSGDEEKLAALQDAFFTLVRADAKNKGKDDPIQTGDYRGITAHRIGPARFATVGEWLLVTNKDELGKAVLDRYLAATQDEQEMVSLAGQPDFQAAQTARPDGALAWAYADVKTLREAGAGQKLIDGPKGNPVGELLLGGIINMLCDAPYAVAALEADQKRLALTAATPFDSARIDEARTYYFGPQGQGAAPPLAAVNETVFSLSAYRDLAAFWAAAPDLFNDAVSAKFAEADSSLTTLFAGRDFGEEVLGAARPELQLVVARQSFPQADLPTPDIKLPAFAVVFHLKDEAQMRRPLKVSFQSIIGFLNVVGAMNAQPPLELNNETRDGVEIVSGRYLPPADPEDAKRGLINYNFSPTAAFAGDRLILSSTQALARKLVEKTPVAAAPEAAANTQAKLDSGVLRAILNDNREQLLAQNMLEKGHSREEAEKEIGALLELLTWLETAKLRLSHDDQLLRLEASVLFTSKKQQDATE